MDGPRPSPLVVIKLRHHGNQQATGWTDPASRELLESAPNIALLPPDDDVDVIFRRTRVLLAPSLWQECCPLVVMEALLRGASL